MERLNFLPKIDLAGATSGGRATAAVKWGYLGAALVLMGGCGPVAAPNLIMDNHIQPSTVEGEPALASLRRLASAELTRLLPGRSLRLSDIIGPGPEIFHEDGTYEARSRILMSGRYAIHNNMVCTWLDGYGGHRCRAILSSDEGQLYIVQIDPYTGLAVSNPHKVYTQ